MSTALIKRVVITLVVLVIPALAGLLLTYEVIKVDWLSTMEMQPSFRPMEDPQQLPPRSVPVQGAAYVPDVGSPQNPVTADQASLDRGKADYEIFCSICHGAQGMGDGQMAASLNRKPANLSAPNVKTLDDGAIFLVISRGVPGYMPPFRESLVMGSRWDVVNYVRSLQK